MEIFKDIPNYEGLYQVSNLGNIKSLSRVVERRNNKSYVKKERILKSNLCNHGYFVSRLSKNSVGKTFLTHQLVAMAFLNHNPNRHKLVVNHINFNKLDNRLENLELTSQRKNTNKKHLKSTSKYTGVYFRKDCSKWHAQITINKKIKYLGLFVKEKDAHIKYQQELKKSVSL